MDGQRNGEFFGGAVPAAAAGHGRNGTVPAHAPFSVPGGIALFSPQDFIGRNGRCVFGKDGRCLLKPGCICGTGRPPETCGVLKEYAASPDVPGEPRWVRDPSAVCPACGHRGTDICREIFYPAGVPKLYAAESPEKFAASARGGCTLGENPEDGVLYRCPQCGKKGRAEPGSIFPGRD